ncbi:uncharacterized protein LOC122629464 [Vespula pensylvanica]|uniref:uncharacterized protein LOC122629464 n=1 Tax=Vespula pensylvanica TaxID=30213 RepID=UPI001CBA20A4|nr:uncharacterized protein LOC122629464 [Vespula pensylvanica]
METQLIRQENGIDYVLLTNNRLEEALRIQASTMADENIAIGLDMFEESGAPEEMQLIFREVVKDGVSIIALDSDTNEMAGVIFNKMHIPLKDGEEDAFESFMEKNIKHRSCIELINFLNNVESKVNIFEKYNVDAMMEMFYLGTDTKYRGRGIGKILTECTLKLGKMLQNGEIKKVSMVTDETIVLEAAIPKVVIAVYTSNYSIRIGEKLNGEFLVNVFYEDFIINGKKMSERIGSNHKRVALVAYKL